MEDHDEVTKDPAVHTFRKLQQFYFNNGNILLESDEGKSKFLRILALLGDNVGERFIRAICR